MNNMGLLELLIVLLITGVILYFITTYIPMPQWMKALINAVAIIVVLLYVLQVFGISHFGHFRIVK